MLAVLFCFAVVAVYSVLGVNNDTIRFKQDVVDRYWFTAINGSQSPPLPIDWPFLPFKSVQQIMSTNPFETDPPLWFVDGISSTIYASKSTSNWQESLRAVQVNLNHNEMKSIVNTMSHVVVLQSQSLNANQSFYAVISGGDYSLQLWYCVSAATCNTVMDFEVSWLQIASSVKVTDLNAYLATDDGLVNVSIYNVDPNNPSNAKLSFEFVFDDILIDENGDEDNDVLAVAYSANLHTLAVAQSDKVYRFNLSSITNQESISNHSYSYTWTFGLVDSIPRDMSFFYDDLYVVNNACINALRYMQYDGVQNMQTWIRIGRHQGLPYDQITRIQLGWDNSVWIAHDIDTDTNGGSVSRFIPNTINYHQNATNTSVEGEWRYYMGNRWLTGDIVTEMYGASELNMMFVATTSGLTVFQGNATDLRTKADEIEETNYPRHDRYGQVGSCGFAKYGNLSSWYPTSSDNNGLWTSMYLSGLAMKYALTEDNATSSRVWHHTNALQMLHNVTGIQGLVARSFSPISDGYLGPTWVNSTTMPGWQWKSDTSSDEICGHIYVYAVLYDTVAKSESEKTFVLDLMISIVDYIIKNDFQLIDYTGRRTTWGFWDPYSLNQVREYFDERGLNSLQIMSWILAAHYYTNLHVATYPQYRDVYNVDDYLQQWLYLGNEHGYFANIVNTKITIPDDINHSDDELAGLSYMVYEWVRYQYTKHKNVFNNTFNQEWSENIGNNYAYFDISWNRQFQYVSGRYLSWYSTIELLHRLNVANKNPNNPPAAIDEETLKQYAIEDLQRWPMDWISWPVVNDDRIDLIYDWTMGRSCGDAQDPTCSRYTLPHDEVIELRWNANPYEMNGGSGYSEQDTGAFTMTYWLAKYFSFI